MNKQKVILYIAFFSLFLGFIIPSFEITKCLSSQNINCLYSETKLFAPLSRQNGLIDAGVVLAWVYILLFFFKRGGSNIVEVVFGKVIGGNKANVKKIVGVLFWFGFLYLAFELLLPLGWFLVFLFPIESPLEIILPAGIIVWIIFLYLVGRYSINPQKAPVFLKPILFNFRSSDPKIRIKSWIMYFLISILTLGPWVMFYGLALHFQSTFPAEGYVSVVENIKIKSGLVFVLLSLVLLFYCKVKKITFNKT